ncbi:MAG: helix-turn-helix domain-containing protein [Coprobacillus cateniformis]
MITAQKLVVKRINELCKEHNLNYYALAYKAAIPKSTLLNIIHGTNPTIETIQKICGGFDISLGTFFNTDYFTKFMMMNEMEKYYNVAYCFV